MNNGASPTELTEVAGPEPGYEIRVPSRASDLTLPRTKPPSLAVSIAYRLFRGALKVAGHRRLLELCLDAGWLFNRFASETWSELFHRGVHDTCLGMTEEMLMDWIEPGDSVIDIGCGRGRWCRATARVASQSVGIDYNQAHIVEARALSPQPNVRYVVGDVGQDLAAQLDREAFDVVLLFHVLEHIDDADALLIELRTLARRLVIEVPDFDADRLNTLRYSLGTRYYSDADHVREYTTEILLDQLAKTGWRARHHQRFRGSIVAVAERAPV